MDIKANKFLSRITPITVLVILLVFLHGSNLTAQTYSFYKFNNEQGLSSSKIYSVLQDRNDFIWLGTGSGLDRFDGKYVEPLTTDNGIWHGGVWSIFEDNRGVVWFGHLDGKISYFDGLNFGKVLFDTLGISGDITSIFELNGKFWFTTFGEGAFSAEFGSDTGTLTNFKQYRGGEGLSDRVTSSYIDPRGVLFIIADVGVKMYVPGEDRFTTYKPNGLSAHSSTITMFEDSRGDTWFGTNKDFLVRLEAETGDPKFYDIKDGLANNEVVCITEDSRGRIWAGTWGGGVAVFDGDEILTFNRDNGLYADNIRSIVEDREGNMLIATYSNGLNIFKGDHFVNFDSDRFFTNNSVMAVNEDKFSRLWFGNPDGATIYNPDTKLSYMYKSDDGELGYDVISINNDLDGNVWLATKRDGVYKYRFNLSRFTKEDEINTNLPFNNVITCMAVDHENNLWIGTEDGVVVWSTLHEVGIRYTQFDGIASNTITSIFVDKDGTIWMGSMLPNGFTKYNPTSGKFKIINLKEDLSPITLTQTGDGILWFGTASSGVYSFENDSITKHLTVQDGLLSSDIRVLQTDDKGYLFIATNKGLNRYELTTGRMISYTDMNGFAGIEANTNASVKAKDGNLWFGTVNGVTRLSPDIIPETDKEPLTHIKGLTVGLEPEKLVDELKLSYKDNSLVFNYYSICLTNPDAVRYKTMLEGAEPGWSEETNLTRQPYPSLSPGRYTFKVKSINSNGIWNSEPETFTFTIKPPFYFSAPFLISMAIFLIIAIYLFIKQRERNLIMEKQILEDKVEERTAEVVEKSKLIEEKNRDITASIRYAERIQMAMLPPEDSFKDTFVLFLPKDIVSGDFYWMYDNGDTQFLAAVDCTGHGVPGAFMSIIGSNSLTKIVREYGIIRPAAILDQLNLEVTKSLVTRGETVINDGMDLALISYDKKKKKLEFAGAYNPLVIVRKGEHITIKADRFPIGMSHAGQKKFTNNEVEVESGDMLYMFSDGFADQFGGPDSKKFKSLNLKNEFLKISNLPVEAQKDHLINILKDWMGEQTQIDDILIIGTRMT